MNKALKWASENWAKLQKMVNDILELVKKQMSK
jgi:hypothetical protein